MIQVPLSPKVTQRYVLAVFNAIKQVRTLSVYFSFAEYPLAQASYQCWQCNSVFTVALIQYKDPGRVQVTWFFCDY